MITDWCGRACPGKGWNPALNDEKEASTWSTGRKIVLYIEETMQLESSPKCNGLGVFKGQKEMSAFEHCKWGWEW